MIGSGSADETLVAREAELSHLLSAHKAVAAGTGRLVLLTGEPGIGKTRLAREVLARAQALGNLVLVGRCFEEYAAVPFFPFTELLGAALSAAPAALNTEATLNWPELVYLIPDFMPATPHKLEGPEAQLRLFRCVLSFLQALGDVKPLVLLLEDLHWADTSLALLLFLGRHLDTARMLILGTYRDVELGRQHPLEATVRELLREYGVEEMHLRRLVVEGTAALASAHLGAATVSDELVALVHGRAQGNSFFTQELLTAFVETGALSAGEGRVGLVGIEEVQVPRSIRSVIGERIGRLPDQSQELLRLASLLGQDFDLEMLLAASGQTEADVLDGLDTALEAGIIGALPKDHEQFAFAHVLIQQTLYEELPVHRRRRMHLRVGRALEQVHVARSTRSADMARHFLLGGDNERAFRYAIEAGDQAAHRYAHPEAEQQYRVALELLDDQDDAATGAELQYRLGGELFDMARTSEALVAYEASLGGFRRLDDRRGQALAHLGIARLHEGLYNMASAEPHIDEALRLWPGERQDSELVRLLSDATRIKAFVGRIAESSELAERNLTLAEQLADAGLVAMALSGMSQSHGGRAYRAPELRLYLERAIDLALRVGNWRTLTLLYTERATNRALTGDIDGSVADRRRAIDAADRSGQTERMIFAHQTLGAGLMWTGAWEDARAALRTGLMLDPLHEHPYSVFTNAVLAWMEGRPDEAGGYFNQFVVNSRQRHDSQGVVLGLAQLAALKVQLDRPAEAETQSREALGVLRSWGGLIGLAAGPVAEVFIRLRTQDSESVLSELERLVDECGEELARPQLLRARALLRAHQHRFDDALGALHASAALARSQHAVTELAQTLLLLASVARQTGDGAKAAVADAERLAMVERIGPEARVMAWARGQPHATRPQAAGQAPLSPRECDVARLIVGGLSNRQIAESLVISERTVENHVSSILARLGVGTRAQVAAWAVQHGLTAPAR